MSLLSVEKFGDRAEVYSRYRPGYPPALAELLITGAGLAPGSTVADVGSGTGISAALFLGLGFRVLAVEPNAAMRAEAERLWSGRPDFVSVDGTAESIPAADGTVQLVTAGTAFHWFDPVAAGREFRRVLAPGGSAALFWNRRLDGDGFSHEYEALLRELPGYRASEHRVERKAEDLAAFFGVKPQEAHLANEQALDRDALVGRALSSSYAPAPGSPASGEFGASLRRLFDRHERDGAIVMRYDTCVFYGQMEAAK